MTFNFLPGDIVRLRVHSHRGIDFMPHVRAAVDPRAALDPHTPKPIHRHPTFFCTDPSTLHTTVRTDKHFDWYAGVAGL